MDEKINPENLPEDLIDSYHRLKEWLSTAPAILEAEIIKAETKLEQTDHEHPNP